jgi:hypothetical protein
MTKDIIAIFFTILFVTVITAPSIIVVIDENIDVSILYGCAEEEESEKNNTFELMFSDCKNETIAFVKSIGQSSLSYRLKNYPKPHLHLICPPPEFI